MTQSEICAYIGKQCSYADTVGVGWLVGLSTAQEAYAATDARGACGSGTRRDQAANVGANGSEHRQVAVQVLVHVQSALHHMWKLAGTT